MEEQGQIGEKEKKLRNEMLFSLSERDRGTLAIVVTSNEWKRKQLHRFLGDHLNEYSFFDLDLTAHSYTSLYRALQELLPESIRGSQPVQYLVSVTGLESSLYKTEDGRIEFSSLVAQLNFERELIFNQPYIILLWISEGFDRELQRKAPDLMHWMSKRFVFQDDNPDGLTVAEEAIAYGSLRKRGKIKERLDRIAQLEETWERLCLYNEDKARLIRDKINLLLLLGKEYGAAFDLEKAEEALKKAIALDARVDAGFGGRLFFELGRVNYHFARYEPALQYFLKSLEGYIREGGENPGSIHHMIGMAYAGVQKWDEAMKSYGLALESKINSRMDYELASTYHEMGIAYAAQQKWNEALESYRLALEWKKKTGGEAGLASTYHQIGLAYASQMKWNEALENYRQAQNWKRAGDEYDLGETYHQVGVVYEEQRKWDEALENYEKALSWHGKTGNEYAFGVTYHQIGSVFEGQGAYEKALDCYTTAVENLSRFNHPDLPVAQSSLSRIRQKLDESRSPQDQPTP
ncbi:tetratricopeptide repeat protein [Puia sp.]|jgi:tetratricopeptide (TPR) repeat protein|uniref:tetratricopeptide repeat protein n=1 Tax=Puia sp. TaxID=2045100 RepID=UPI002F4051E0